MATCVPQDLLTSGKCFDCLTKKELQIVQLVMLCNIAASGGGGGGGGTTQVYVGKDPAAPDDPTKGAISYPAGGGTITQWNPGTATWV